MVDVVPERCEPQPLVSASGLPYPFQRVLQVGGGMVGAGPWLVSAVSRYVPV